MVEVPQDKHGINWGTANDRGMAEELRSLARHLFKDTDLAEAFSATETEWTAFLALLVRGLEAIPHEREIIGDHSIMKITRELLHFIEMRIMKNHGLVSSASKEMSNHSLEEGEDGWGNEKRVPGPKMTVPTQNANRAVSDYIAGLLVDQALDLSKGKRRSRRSPVYAVTEDLCHVLGHPQWPGAVLLLECILGIVGGLAVNDSQSIASKEMTLDILITVSGGINICKHCIKQSKRALVDSDRLEPMIMDSQQEEVKSHFRQFSIDILLYYSRSHSSRLRVKAIDGIFKVLEGDTQILPRQLVKRMANWFFDELDSVRQRCVSMVAKVAPQDQLLKQYFLPCILQCAGDPCTNVKKQAIILIRDVYCRNISQADIRKITCCLLSSSRDSETEIADNACTALEVLWLNARVGRQDSQRTQITVDQTVLLADTIVAIQEKPNYFNAFKKFFVSAASSNPENFAACEDIIANLIQMLCDPMPASVGLGQAGILHALVLFAAALPCHFTMKQVRCLRYFVKEILRYEDIATLRPAVTIFHHILPGLSPLEEPFATELGSTVSKNIPKLACLIEQGVQTSRITLEEVIRCLWTISGGRERLAAILNSILVQITPFVSCTKYEARQKRKTIICYLVLLGTIGGICDFNDSTIVTPVNVLNPGQLVSLTLLDAVRPFTMEGWDMNIREPALFSIGQICRHSPRLFIRHEVEKMFQLALKKEEVSQTQQTAIARLKCVALMAFRDYFALAEQRSENVTGSAVNSGGMSWLDSSCVATDDDCATMHLAKTFLEKFSDVALESHNDLARIATTILTSISRQGLIPPKTYGPVLVALSTSTCKEIAAQSAIEFKRIYTAYGSLLKDEYLSAVRLAFEYQKKLFEEPRGMYEIGPSKYSPTMQHFLKILSDENSFALRDFIKKICKELEFHLPEWESMAAAPDRILFSRFCLENLGLFRFTRYEQIFTALEGLETIVLHTTGPIIALAVEMEMPKQQRRSASIVVPSVQCSPVSIEDTRLHQLAVACVILHMIWETLSFIRRCYGGHRVLQASPLKDRPQRSNCVPDQDLWDKISQVTNCISTRENMITQCYALAELVGSVPRGPVRERTNKSKRNSTALSASKLRKRTKTRNADAESDSEYKPRK